MAVVQAVLVVSELTYGICEAGVQAIQVVWEPSSNALWGSCAGCLSGVGNNLPGTVGQWCMLFKRC